MFVIVWYWSILPISFSVAGLALGQLCDCPSANEATLKGMGKWITVKQLGTDNMTKWNKVQPNHEHIFGMLCMLFFSIIFFQHNFVPIYMWTARIVNIPVFPFCLPPSYPMIFVLHLFIIGEALCSQNALAFCCFVTQEDHYQSTYTGNNDRIPHYTLPLEETLLAYKRVTGLELGRRH